MDEWIPFEEGKYLAERALLVSAAYEGIELENTVIEVSEDRQKRRRLRGRGRFEPARMVNLLDGGDELDLLLDFGGEFKYRMRRPEIQSGKVFAPGVKSVIQFFPQQPWEQVPEAEFSSLIARIRIFGQQQD
jgi:hypothetical protein